MSRPQPLSTLAIGTQVLVNGNQFVTIDETLAAAFSPGDQILVTHAGTLLHVPSTELQLVDDAVRSAHRAFGQLGTCTDEAITEFFAAFAQRLADDTVFALIANDNAADVAAAQAKGRSTTRLMLSAKMRADMIAGLHVWRDTHASRDAVIEAVDHKGWRVEQRRAPLGVVGFVFEGRPNVFADASGVLRSGNTVVFRIGSDALGTARAIMRYAVEPALVHAGLPQGCVELLDSPSRATGWALFSHRSLALAVARGSGEAVAQLGSVARQAGVPVSLHGTGGAWLVASEHADPDRFYACIRHSLDRKVCNTMNVCAIVKSRADELIPWFLRALDAAAEARGTSAKLHVVEGSEAHLPPDRFTTSVTIRRAAGDVQEAAAETIAMNRLRNEWEWEESPEVTLVVVNDLTHAIDLCNEHSPALVASLISDDAAEHQRFWATVNSPFIGDGFTRWVDGQFALNRPELGLSNWEHGRLFARGPVLSGDSVFTVRLRAYQSDQELHR